MSQKRLFGMRTHRSYRSACTPKPSQSRSYNYRIQRCHLICGSSTHQNVRIGPGALSLTSLWHSNSRAQTQKQTQCDLPDQTRIVNSVIASNALAVSTYTIIKFKLLRACPSPHRCGTVSRACRDQWSRYYGMEKQIKNWSKSNQKYGRAHHLQLFSGKIDFKLQLVERRWGQPWNDDVLDDLFELFRRSHEVVTESYTLSGLAFWIDSIETKSIHSMHVFRYTNTEFICERQWSWRIYVSGGIKSLS